ncbi:CarD family transcriptional regulator [Bacteriovorax sp. DB6_IX]|uniref:CarD family transcriptional regulator n=1 Tax=Bacteriovorax sp. DB6_IX TaxID=1353530 RepID=UPI000389E6B4|nr:CarD family transcriptional regulator [Bacteriovorax sp. DB6_IX]EQC52580.1 CarD-like protein [Bacteriovorax sp. DB6_IX]
MFNIGDYAVCPGHGVGQIVDIEEREVGGDKLYFYIIKVIANGMTVMVPTNSENGIRGLVDDKEIGEVYELLNDHDVKVDNSTWNRRYRDYMAKVKTGSLLEIADVLRSLFLLKNQKNLSFGEKKMLDQCKDLIVQEISITNGMEKQSISSKIEDCFENETTQQ